MNAHIRKSVQAMSGYVPGLQPKTADIVKLNTNENPYTPSPAVLQAITGLVSDSLRRYPDPACTELIEAISELHRCDPEQVFVGNGSDEVLALCTRAFVENDGTIGYFTPSYSLYPVLADIRDVQHKAVALTTDFEWPGSLIAEDRLPEAADSSLFFMTNPNAPTGIRYPHDAVDEFCRRAQGVVVVDEAYVDFADSDCVDLALTRENILVARTLSKAYGLAGLRLGYALGPPALIKALNTIKDSYNVNVMTQRLATAAIRDHAYMREQAAAICATRTRLAEALMGLGFTVCPSQANFLWVRPTETTAKELFEHLTEHHILVRYFAGELTGAYIRITIGTDQQVDRLLDVIATAPTKEQG